VKIGKILISAFLVLVVLIVALFIFVYANINGIVKEVVVQTGQEVLQTKVSLDEVDIKLPSASGELKGFALKNYPEFEHDSILEFSSIKIDLDPRSTSEELVVIDEVTIDGVKLVAEQKGTQTNLQVMLDKIEEYSSDSPSSGSSAGSSAEESPAKDIRVAIKKLNFVNNSVTIASEKWGDLVTPLPNITRENIGDPKVGLTPAELAKEMIKPLIKQANAGAKGELKKQLEKEVKEKYGDEIDKAKDKLKNLF
jgi:protein required for attachment to host cells